MDKKLEGNRTPEVRMTAENIREIVRLAEEKYGPDWKKMTVSQILKENPGWVKELELPLNWRGILVTSEKSLQGIETVAEIDRTIKESRSDFMNRTSGEKKDSVPPPSN